jgi:hypothetical protein
MPITSSQLAYFTSLTPTQLSELIVQSGGPSLTFVTAKFKEVTNPSLPDYAFLYTAYLDDVDYRLVQVTYDSAADTTTAALV